jgi:hypothetical protein
VALLVRPNARRESRGTEGTVLANARASARNASRGKKEHSMTLGTLLLILLVLMLLGAVPAWPYSRGWGYAPSGIVGVLVVILLIALLTGSI